MALSSHLIYKVFQYQEDTISQQLAIPVYTHTEYILSVCVYSVCILCVYTLCVYL